jgi:serine/threonine-protein kinase
VQRQLFIRPLSGDASVPVAGSANAVSPFFSTDSRWLAFFAEGKLKKVPVAGGTPLTITDAAVGFGGSWGADDTIVFSPAPGAPLYRVPAAGGTPTRLTRLDADRGEFSHRWPEILPNGRAVLFTVGTLGSWDDAEIIAESLDGSRREVLVKGGTHPHFLPTGHVLYTHASAGWVVPFDADRLALTGPPVRLLNDVLASSDGASQLSVSLAGTLVYLSATALQPPRRLMALDDRSDLAPLAAAPRHYVGPRLSPDGRKIVLTIVGAAEEVWIYDISSGTLDSLTSESDNRAPIWTPDGRYITFSSNRGGGAFNLYTAPIDGSAPPERLTTSDNIQLTGSWSATGEYLAYVEHHPQTGRDIWLLHAPERRATPLVTTPSDETGPAFSPDGRWISYVSNRSGRNDVYVRSVSQPAVESVISPDGGSEPVWARDGRELYYREGDRLMAVAADALPRQAQPRVVFKGAFEPGTPDRANYDVAGSARRFVLLAGAGEQAAPGAFNVLINWFAGVRPR